MNDTISRQAAIDALDKRFDNVPMEQTAEILKLRKDLRELPSAQPDHNADIGKKVEAEDCISRRMAIDALKNRWKKTRNYEGIGDDIAEECELYLKQLPAAQPEIIRCKDCKYWRDDHTCHEHSLVSPMCANEYCSRAERRRSEHID